MLKNSYFVKSKKSLEDNLMELNNIKIILIILVLLGIAVNLSIVHPFDLKNNIIYIFLGFIINIFIAFIVHFIAFQKILYSNKIEVKIFKFLFLEMKFIKNSKYCLNIITKYSNYNSTERGNVDKSKYFDIITNDNRLNEIERKLFQWFISDKKEISNKEKDVYNTLINKKRI